MINYIALIHKDSESDYGVSFPDFPGCVTASESIDEAKDMALEALSGHIIVMKESGERIPEPSSLEKIISSQKNKNIIAFFIVPIQDKRAKKKRVNITLPEEELHIIDSFAKQHGMTRSSFLLKAAKESIQTQTHS
jgi:predicted RNase H-like HicB family nuclease